MKQKQDPDAFIPVTSCTQGDRQYGCLLFDKVWVENARENDMGRRIFWFCEGLYN